MAPGRDELIEALPLRVNEEDARRRVTGRAVARLKRLFSDRSVVQVRLRYKPYYYFEATLRRRYLTDDDLVYEGAIVVDAMSGISRAVLDELVDLSERSVPTRQLLDADLPEADARTKAKGRRMQVAARERGEIEMAEEPRLVYKPVWLVELATSDVEVVDGTTGEVMTEAMI